MFWPSPACREAFRLAAAAEIMGGTVGPAEIIGEAVGTAGCTYGAVGTAGCTNGAVGTAGCTNWPVGTAGCTKGAVGTAGGTYGAVGTAVDICGAEGVAEDIKVGAEADTAAVVETVTVDEANDDEKTGTEAWGAVETGVAVLIDSEVTCSCSRRI